METPNHDGMKCAHDGSHTTIRGAAILMAFGQWIGRAALALAFLLVVRCGDDDNGPYIDYLAACVPSLPDNWVPTWRPAHAPDPTACTDTQINAAYEACKGRRATRETCRRFGVARDTSRCSACLLSSSEDGAWGPIVALPNYYWTFNTSGCISVVDGAADSGCAAHVQAAESCYAEACGKCLVDHAYDDCYLRARQGVCRSFYLDAVCMYRSSYAVCVDWATDPEAFRAMGKLFCSNTPPAADTEPAKLETELLK